MAALALLIGAGVGACVTSYTLKPPMATVTGPAADSPPNPLQGVWPSPGNTTVIGYFREVDWWFELQASGRLVGGGSFNATFAGWVQALLLNDSNFAGWETSGPYMENAQWDPTSTAPGSSNETFAFNTSVAAGIWHLLIVNIGNADVCRGGCAGPLPSITIDWTAGLRVDSTQPVSLVP